jgi:hypothetical protein
MSSQDTIRILLGRGRKGHAPLDPQEWKRVAARVAWARALLAKLWEAQERCDEAWMRRVRALPDDASEEELEAIPEPPEQAEFDALYAQVRAVIDENRWPRELYSGKL